MIAAVPGRLCDISVPGQDRFSSIREGGKKSERRWNSENRKQNPRAGSQILRVLSAASFGYLNEPVTALSSLPHRLGLLNSGFCILLFGDCFAPAGSLGSKAPC
jgi:hypothetical protein